VEMVYGSLGIKNDPPLTRFLVRQLSKSRWFNITAARRDLGYVPKISIDEGLRLLRESWEDKTTPD
ncbi:MAG: 3-beta hydroxysteroid dehydrogenase, partial [Anaerolineae bacterium]|nr:3-beta hydroxysteroid dehydrogenase [Anaerolineae bacterium]